MQDEAEACRNRNGKGAGAAGTALAAYQEYYTLREQARDHVKTMIQADNPGQYEHVEHEMKADHRERVAVEATHARARRIAQNAMHDHKTKRARPGP
jgi:hypothetical protein